MRSIMACSQSFPCAGRALRNAFVAASPHPAKDQIQLARIIRRSYVGLELVEWILQQCLFIQCRVVAAGIWQILLELGILLSDKYKTLKRDQQYGSRNKKTGLGCFLDDDDDDDDDDDTINNNTSNKTHIYAHILSISFEPFKQLNNGRLQISYRLVNLPPGHTVIIGHSVEDLLEFWFIFEVIMSWDCGLKYLFALSPTLQPGAVCTLHYRDDISRIEMVQRLAKDSCRFLQTPNIKVPDKTFEKQKSVTMVVSNASLGQPLIQDIIYFSRGILIK
ncbi:UNVERIFIED_CONTAM: hypothetical protein FKN15_039514 [Acipenser sinensis]